MFHNSFIHNSSIEKIKFVVSGSETNKKDGNVNITSTELFDNSNIPIENGVYSNYLGTTDHSVVCQTCQLGKNDCLGHEGIIFTNSSIPNPLSWGDINKWLKVICFNCGKIILNENQYKNFSKNKKLDEASKIARNGVHTCVHCGVLHPIIKKDEQISLKLIAYTKSTTDKKLNIKEPEVLYPSDIKKIFSKISNETVISMGKDIETHPNNFILDIIKVPSTIIRPDVKKLGGGKSTNDSLTTMLQYIIKCNDKLPKIIPQIENKKYDKQIYDLVNAYYDFIKGGNNTKRVIKIGVGEEHKSITERLKGKQGSIRKHQLGKRVRGAGRSTITGDSKLKPNELGIPLEFAKTLQIAETVQEYNIKQLSIYVANGKRKYPGSTKIIKKSTGAEYNVEAKQVDLEIGDTVFRDLITGDPVNFNRAPSLTISNISTMYVVVCEDPTILTLRMNVLVCPLFNADFDGDQMNIIINKRLHSRNEMMELSTIDNWLISHTNGAPAIGQTYDSVIGLFELTKSNVRFDKYHALQIYQDSIYTPVLRKLEKDDYYTGRELISGLLKETPINLKGKTNYYNEALQEWIDYNPADIKVEIKNGKLISGVLDSKTIGKSSGGLYHIIANQYNNKKAIEVMYNMQQSAINYLLQYGMTIGINDLLISKQAKNDINDIASQIMIKADLITDKLNRNEIIPPIGQTVLEFYEAQIIEILKVFDDFNEPILKSININHNNLFKLVMSGSKGKFEHLNNMVATNGQKLINGARITLRFGYGRVSPYFPRFETSPESRGYIANSYTSGLNSTEFIVACMNARFDLIVKALSTADTGEQNRKSIKNLESIIINNFRWCIKGSNIIQLGYGDDCIDPRKTIKAKFTTVMLSDADFKTQFTYTMDKPDKLIVEEFTNLTNDRNKYREIFLKIEKTNHNVMLSIDRDMPVDIERLVINETNLLDYKSPDRKKPTDKEIIEMIQMVKDFVEYFPYLLLNDIQYRNRMPLPEPIKACTWLMIMLIRTYLCSVKLSANKLNKLILKKIIDQIAIKYSHSLIDAGTAIGIISAQAFSEPLTQYMLDAHHHSALGGTSKSTMLNVKDLLSARSVEKLTACHMVLPVLEQYATDKFKVQEIANNIEAMLFKQFVTSWQVFFENYKDITHPKYLNENDFITKFEELNPLLSPPTDLVKWCIRYKINKSSLILKNMSIETIITKLRDSYPDTFIIHTAENSPEVIIRVYFKASMFKKVPDLTQLVSIKNQMLDTLIRGVSGIVNTTVVEMFRNKINTDGSISQNKDIWGIKTNGTNLYEISFNPKLDVMGILSDAIQDVYQQLGIEASRKKLIIELKRLVDVCGYRHLTVYADEMTYTGKVTSIERSGLNVREQANILLRMSFGSPIQTIEEALSNSAVDNISGLSSQLLLGTTPHYGTLYNQFRINEEFLKDNVKSVDSYIEDL